MKRAAAILGPTPPFIRWAIETPCPFLRMSDANSSRNPAQSRWRQLRSLKEIAQAEAEGRVYAGYCFASTASATNVMGVQIDEVTTPLGGTERVTKSCQLCPANPTPQTGHWAPCTGIFPLINPLENLQDTKQKWAKQLSSLEEAISAASVLTTMSEAPMRPLGWYLTWKGPLLESEQLQVALRALELSMERFPHAPLEAKEFRAALEHASRRSLKVWIEPVPIGWSDGQTWQLPAHCQICGAEWSGSGAGACDSCGSPASYQAARRLKVLGLRPFIQLANVLGSEPARQLFADYQAARLKPSLEDSAGL